MRFHRAAAVATPSKLRASALGQGGQTADNATEVLCLWRVEEGVGCKCGMAGAPIPPTFASLTLLRNCACDWELLKGSI